MARHSTHIELLLFMKLETYDVWRWIEYTAVKIESFDIFGISFISALGSHIHHEGQYIIIGADRKKQMKEKRVQEVFVLFWKRHFRRQCLKFRLTVLFQSVLLRKIA